MNIQVINIFSTGINFKFILKCSLCLSYLSENRYHKLNLPFNNIIILNY